MPRTLAAAARSSFTANARERGERYYMEGRVAGMRVDGNTFIVSVIGTLTYDVWLSLDNDRLLVDCTCPQFFENTILCKHMWAAILAADEKGVFSVSRDVWIDFEDRFDGGRRLPPGAAQKPRPVQQPPAPPPPWQVFLSRVAPPPADPLSARTATAGELIYVLDVPRSAAGGAPLIELMSRARKKSGEWAKPKTVNLAQRDLAHLPDVDRQILEIVVGGATSYGYGGTAWGYHGGLPIPSAFSLNVTLQRELLPRICGTGRVFLRGADTRGDRGSHAPPIDVAWSPEPAEFVLRITGTPEAGYTIGGAVRTGGRERPVADAILLTSALILWRPEDPAAPAIFAPFDPRGADRWVAQFLTMEAVAVPSSEASGLVQALAVSNITTAECPEELRVTTVEEPPRPIVRVTRPPGIYPYRGSAGERLHAQLAFSYGNKEVGIWSTEPAVFDPDRRISYRRAHEVEGAALARLQSLGVRRVVDWQTNRPRLDFAATVLPTLVRLLLADGWSVEAEGRLYRRPGAMTLDVRSGVDWFELHGAVDFGGVSASLPALLAAARRGDTFIPLGDGTFGLLPKEWLERNGRIAAVGTTDGDHVRFARQQAALLDAWLATQPAASVDQMFTHVRGELARFDGIRPVDPPATFAGVLRDYQREALGWFEFLRRFGFGGCLADEMGLGKTVMVLAMLEARRAARQASPSPLAPRRSAHAAPPPSRSALRRPSRLPDPLASLVVMPRSLIFNWLREAARFAPALRVLDYTGGGRRQALDGIATHDVVLTTYGTLRRDAAELKDVEFDYVILDESQAIKNANTSSAKAARLLKGRHRLALSGTPVENHLGELWSLFDFLNPGILGAASVFSLATASGASAARDREALQMLARGLRPFILRRTKEQVAAELPPRTEQTLYCDLEPPQRALYDELRDHYRAALLGKVERQGLGRAKLQILEALLRLRQAACHPALIDRARAGDGSAKLDVLVPRLQELVEDGRKVLVFSQFTSLLALLRDRLDEARLTYEYLDGKTRDRAARVERFQTDGCPLFLISLKAGGLGLNLTAAEYVFLLDPWWNPAVEAQAIDRAHRIGQRRPVFAFRLIARNTVEEKVLELQASKRQLADAIVRADVSLIRDLRREDLELLLS
jgi:superfamily II DNA or RNA helicase